MTRFLILLAVLNFVVINSINSADWSNTNIQYLYGSTFELGDSSRDTFTFEHTSEWKYGDNFFFFNIEEPLSKNTAIYGEFSPSLSFSKISGLILQTGIFKDIIVVSDIEMGNSYRAFLIGVGVDFDIPFFDFFRIKLYSRNNPNALGSTFQVTIVWNIPIDIKYSKIIFRGYIDLWGMEGSLYGSQLTHSQLVFDVGALWNSPDKLFAGIEYIYFGNKFGLKNIDESVIQPMISWVF